MDVDVLSSRTGRHADVGRPSGGVQEGAVAVMLSPLDLAPRLFGTDLRDLVEAGAPAAPPVVSAIADLGRDAASVEVLVTGWGAASIGVDDLRAMRALRAIVHAGGDVDGFVDPDELLRRGVDVSTAGEINAISVAEYTLAAVLQSNKRTHHAERLYRTRRGPVDREVELGDTGNVDRVVGVVGASRVGLQVLELLGRHDLELLVHDPHIAPEAAAALGARWVDLATLMSTSDVVTLHQPLTDATRGQIDAALVASMRPGATLVNTARGPVVDHDALLRRLQAGDLHAVLDVTDPEPLPADHPLWELPNVVLTPHIAGATGTELRRMGRHVAAEVARRLRAGRSEQPGL